MGDPEEGRTEPEGDATDDGSSGDRPEAPVPSRLGVGGQCEDEGDDLRHLHHDDQERGHDSRQVDRDHACPTTARF